MKFAVIFLPAIFGTLVSADGKWAQFCDDDACSVNCGIAVDVDNTGCLANEYNRGSVRFHGRSGQHYYISVSPGPNCECQSSCQSVQHVCLKLDPFDIGQSYSFKKHSCDPYTTNNC